MIVFGEHQSTVNENMPWRSVYRTCFMKGLYRREAVMKKKIVFSSPEFYTFYNGKEKWKGKELRLSDAWYRKDGELSLN